MSGGRMLTLESMEDFLIADKIVSQYLKMAINISAIPSYYADIGIWYGVGQTCPGMYDDDNDPMLRYINGTYLDHKNLKKSLFGIDIYKFKDDNGIKNKENVCASLYLSGKGIKKDGTKPYFVLERCTKEKLNVCIRKPIELDEENAFNTIENNDQKHSLGYEEIEIYSMSKKYPCGYNIFWCPIDIPDEGVKCYGVVRQRDSWEHSKDICNTYLNGDLASFHSSAEENHVLKIIKEAEQMYSFKTTGFWIGLNRRNAEKTLEWSDDTSLNYLGRFSTFNTVKEENEHSDGNCFIIKSIINSTRYGWHRMRCDSQNSFICEKPGYNYNVNTYSGISKKFKESFEDKGCNDGEKYYNGMCYKLFGVDKNDKKAFNEAQENCKENDMSLVSIVDEYEQNVVLSMLHNFQEDVWIGMNISSGSVRWLDQEIVKFTRFSPVNRIFKSSSGAFYFTNDNFYGVNADGCVSFDGSNHIGYWNIIPRNHLTIPFLIAPNKTKEVRIKNDCGNTKLGYICERYATKEFNSKTESEQAEGSLCHTMVDEDISFCYMKNNHKLKSKRNFKEAKQICDEMLDMEEYQKLNEDGKKKGYLPVTENSFDWAYLLAHADMNNYETFWVGIQYSLEKGFVRHDGGRITMGVWGPQEPNLNNGRCVVTKLERDGPRWYMTSCYDEHETICKISYKKTKQPAIDVKCPTGKEDWILGKTKCYFIERDKAKKVPLANNDHNCYLHYNASLASFPTKEDFQLFTSYEHINKNSNDKIYIGLERMKYGKYVWVDGSQGTFFNWDKNEPSRRGPISFSHLIDTRCTVLRVSKGYTWAADFCKRDYDYVCSVDVVDVNEIEPEPEEKEEEKSKEAVVTKEPGKTEQKDINEAHENMNKHKSYVKSLIFSLFILALIVMAICGIIYFMKTRQDRIKHQQSSQSVSYRILEAE
uniref:C-type lectin domain-containing protein n=1 Tax=Parastrongyloides trichosuri TaxID=131310 RepID=A0A0N4ZGB0_PARTI